MIGYIKGTVEGILADSVILENNGIGYRIYTSGMVLNSISELHGEMKLFTYMHVRENELSLFGFPTTEELDTFQLLIGVNGIGPVVALAILTVLSVRELAIAIMSNDTKAIAKANKVGAKSASRIVMELKDKLKLDDLYTLEDSADSIGVSRTGDGDNIQDTILALVSLGYSESEALRAVKKIPNADTMDSGALLKKALKELF